MQPYYYARTQRPKRSSALLPFISLIVIVLIGVLIFQIFDYFSEKRRQALENKAAIEVISGRAELKIWGVEEWADTRTGAILHEGDSLKTAPGSRVVLTLLNGSSVRVSSETEIELTNLKTRDGQDELGLRVKYGDVWVKRTENQAVNASFTVTTEHLEVASLGTIFSVSATARESLRVFEGTVQVALRVPEPEDSETIRIADTLEVEFGQEVSLGQEEIRQLQNRRPVQLLTLLSDSFRETEWYTWNRLQDSTNAARISVQDAVLSGVNPLNGLATVADGVITTPVISESSDQTLDPKTITEVFSSPLIIAPLPTDRITATGAITINGSVSPLTQKLEVTTFIAGRPEAYILQKYKAGSTQWSYVATSALGNLISGDNRFSFVAIDKDGNRSDPSELVIRYDRPKIEADFSPPVVISFNGTKLNTTAEESVLITGTIGKGIVKVFVNDFALSRYIPDSGVWSYYAKKEFNNLVDGENIYTVYGMDQDGKKTPGTQFTIIKE